LAFSFETDIAKGMNTAALPTRGGIPKHATMPPPPRQVASPSQGAIWTVVPAVIMIFSAIIPPEIRFDVAEQTFYPTRLAGLALLPWLAMQMARRPIRFIWLEYFFFAAAFWMVFSFMVLYSPLEGFFRGGALAYDTLIPYLIARFSIRSGDDFRRVLIVVSPALLFAGLSMLLENFLGYPLVRPLAASIFGPLPAYENGVAVGIGELFVDRRFGLLRAAGPFAHPIMAGMFLASFLTMYAMSGIRRWPLVVGIASAFFAVCSISSSAFLSLLLAGGLMCLDKVQRMISFLSWKMIVPFVLLALAGAHVASQNGLLSILIRFTLSPQTGHFRRLIWEYGTLSVSHHPWFGIGFAEYERPDWMVPSVDNHWLLLAMRFGIFPSLAIFVFAISVIWLVCLSSSRASAADRGLRVGLAISLFVIVMLGFSVSFVGGVQMWFHMLLAVCVTLYISTRSARGVVVPAATLSTVVQGVEVLTPRSAVGRTPHALPKVERRANASRARRASRDTRSQP
jgi:O-antigen ligase